MLRLKKLLVLRSQGQKNLSYQVFQSEQLQGRDFAKVNYLGKGFLYLRLKSAKF